MTLTVALTCLTAFELFFQNRSSHFETPLVRFSVSASLMSLSLGFRILQGW